MKRRIMRILAVLMLALYLLCTACGGTGETVSPQDDPNEGLGGGFDEDGVTLSLDGSDAVLRLDRTDAGELTDSENGGLLLPVEKIMSTEPYFSRCGLEINAEMDMGSYLLENGVCCYSGLGDGYSTGDWAMVFTKSYVVYMPEDYDGLVLAAEPQPDNYRDTAKRMQLDSISPEGLTTELDTLDPYACLYFSVCC